MKNMFSIGELAKYQDISRQTLIFYDRIGLFKPSLTTEKGYRYYSVEQMDYLDTILILKKLGFSLEDIREHMKNYDTLDSLSFMRGQVENLDRKIAELSLVRNRMEHKCQQLEKASGVIEKEPFVTTQEMAYLFYEDVKAPFDRKEISIATKKCYAKALSDTLPVFFLCGVSVPLDKIREGRFNDASIAFLLSDRISNVKNLRKIPKGKVAAIYHRGNYYEIESSYRKLIRYCEENNLRMISDSYEFVINDYVTSGYEEEFLTKIIFYVE